MNTETKQFIQEHACDDINQLALQKIHDPEIDLKFALQQIAGRQKIRYKVPLFYQSEEILYPVSLSIEQASSEITATYKSSIANGKSFIDLTGGFGIDCFFLSKRFEKSIYVEEQKELCDIASYNFNSLRADNIRIVNASAEDYLQNITESIDCIYIDPARRDDNGKKLVLLSDCRPDIEKLSPLLLEKGKQIIIKLSPMLDINSITNSLSNISEIHVVAVENECKELLIVLKKECTKPVQIKTINFLKNNINQFFEFTITDEYSAKLNYTSELRQYLYEPNAAIMKSGAFKLIAEKFNLNKLHINTHLYTSNDIIPEFPGRIFEIKNNWENSSRQWKIYTKDLPKANLTVRNYPIKTNELRKKLKLSDGGDCYLFACTLANNKRTIIECIKI